MKIVKDVVKNWDNMITHKWVLRMYKQHVI